MWKTIKDFPRYEVSDKGEVRNKQTKHILVPWEATGGYMYIGLCDNGKEYTKRLHRIVAKEFCKHPDGKDCVNHIDGNKKNNSAKNLEWCSISENMIHAFDNGLQSHIGKYPIRGVECINDGKRFNTIRRASEYYGVKRSAIYACCTRKSNRSKSGLIFRFVDTERREDAKVSD